MEESISFLLGPLATLSVCVNVPIWNSDCVSLFFCVCVSGGNSLMVNPNVLRLVAQLVISGTAVIARSVIDAYRQAQESFVL